MEHETKNTDALTNKSEHVELERYEVISDDLIRVAEQTNPMQRLVAMRGFLAELRAEAAGGYIKNSDGDPYDVKQFNLQLDTFLNEINLPEDKREVKDPLKLIPRSEGMRDAFTALISNEATATPLLYALAEKPSAEVSEAAEQKAERTSEQAHEVGGQALKSAEVSTSDDEAKLARLVEGLSEDDIGNLKGYARNEARKREAQQSGDGQDSTLAGQYMGQYFRAMSPAAQNIHRQFSYLYNKMH